MNIIEYFGAPGSGKTYMLKIKKKQLDSEQVKYNDKFLSFSNVSSFQRNAIKLFFICYLFFTSNSSFICLTKTCLGNKNNDFKRKIRLLHNGLYIFGFLFFYRKSSKIILMDQGFFQWLFVSRFDNLKLSKNISLIDKLNISKYEIFNVVTDNNTRINRIKRREKKSISKKVARLSSSIHTLDIDKFLSEILNSNNKISMSKIEN